MFRVAAGLRQRSAAAAAALCHGSAAAATLHSASAATFRRSANLYSAAASRSNRAKTSPALFPGSPQISFRRLCSGGGGIPPEVRTQLERIETRLTGVSEEVRELSGEVKRLEKIVVKSTHARLESALQAGTVAWRVCIAVLAFGASTLLAVLLTVEVGWKAEFVEAARATAASMLREAQMELQKMVECKLEAFRDETKDKSKDTASREEAA